MKKYFRQLSTGEVLTTLIRQEEAPDRTQDLRSLLTQSQPGLEEQEHDAEEMVLLPDFALEDSSEEQLLEMHFRRGNYSPGCLLNYESLLASVDAKMQRIIRSSGNSFENSNQIMDNLTLHLGQFGAFVRQERQPLIRLSRHLT
jgi:hypothetical protein